MAHVKNAELAVTKSDVLENTNLSQRMLKYECNRISAITKRRQHGSPFFERGV